LKEEEIRRKNGDVTATKGKRSGKREEEGQEKKSEYVGRTSRFDSSSIRKGVGNFEVF
jgi:hypothetical protein